nr:hypothetical protein [Tanacetum cinerariifolium]
MNFVPVDAGIISTNFSGTKDTTSQEVTKDVSSLRYIAFPNWAHDALLEFTSSKPQDHCSTKIPKGSGNTNPTASTPNPLADHMKTLTVETPIPTVSSLVLNAYSTDSQDPSSDARLISKRVANQEETPSLDNILLLTNRFEDILGGTTNSDESNGEEADISNMETAISASPTPTLRIHKDHPRSQIIGHVDNLIQTRNKFKEDPEFPAKVYKVEKAMYGLHQAPRAWSSNTPIDKENPWGKDGTGKDVDLHLYRSMIGSLMYLTASRPDIMFVVCACARHQVTPKECHLHAVKRIFRYLNGHPKLGLWYSKESPFDLVAYSDSDYGGATQDRKSTTRGCQFLGRRFNMPCEALSKEISSSILCLFCNGERWLKDLLEFLTFEALDDAPIKGRSMDEGEAATERVSDDTKEMETVLTSMDAVTVLASGVVDVPTGSGSIPTASTPAEGSVPTGSEEVPTVSPVFATATVVTPVTRRKAKKVMVESKTPKEQKVQEQIDSQVARELEEQLEREYQRRTEQIARDAE